jgi:hypothetical protein
MTPAWPMNRFDRALAALEQAPEPLTPGEWVLVGMAAAVSAASRLAALARSPWDWDEALFCLGVQDFDVRLHNPHPPGFPAYVGMAKLIAATGLSPFHALQLINVVAAVLLFPLMFSFCREARLPVRTSFYAALLLVFSPNVWFFGSGAFSDIPSLALILAAATALLAGCRSQAAWLAGACLLGVAVGVRPQNLFIGMVAMAVAAMFRLGRPRGWISVGGGVLIVCAITAVAYGAAAAASGGWQLFREALSRHQQYIVATDSVLSPLRPQLRHLIDDFFFRPYRQPIINIAISTLIVAGVCDAIYRRNKSVFLIVFIFGPFALLAFLLLDYISVSRFSIGYAPLTVALAAQGIAALSAFAGWISRGGPRAAGATAATLASLVLMAMILWTWPALSVVRSGDAPPIRAMTWLRDRAPSRPVVVAPGLAAFANYVLGTANWSASGKRGVTIDWTSRPLWYASEVPVAGAAAHFFWPHAPLEGLVRPRYFDVYVKGFSPSVEFGQGWYAEEWNGAPARRWTSAEAELVLQTGAAGRLSISLYVPRNGLAHDPTLEIWIDGALARRVRASQDDVAIECRVASAAMPHRLVIRTDATVNPARRGLSADSRDLGLLLTDLQWEPAGRSAAAR